MRISPASCAVFLSVYAVCVFPSHSFCLNPTSSSSSSLSRTQQKWDVWTSLAAEPNGASEVSRFTEDSANNLYINGLLQNLSSQLDQYVMSGSKEKIGTALNIMKQIEREAMDDELVQQAQRMVQRAGMALLEREAKEFDTTSSDDSQARKDYASERKEWEEKTVTAAEKESKNEAHPGPGNVVGSKANPASTLSTLESDKKLTEVEEHAEIRTSTLIAEAGAGSAFDGTSLGIGGLDDVLSQVKRRIWVPLAAPPTLMKELGIDPVHGLLLYGAPGCGKTLIARSLGKILSPARPITVVSGPEIMDRFVGSSEKNLRNIFDDPPDIYDTYRLGTKDNGAAVAKSALHVIIMDEFDAIARSRGGSGESQGDAGVARDSVVNQLLAKMDGVEALKVPTLLIALTNKRSLIDPALLRPGRFEVQIEVPPPNTLEQRISILKVHTDHMYKSGRLLVCDVPPRTAGNVQLERLEVRGEADHIPSYGGLLEQLAIQTSGMTGASLAGVARAAASRALERAVFSSEYGNINECVVTISDFENAINDVNSSAGRADVNPEEVVANPVPTKTVSSAPPMAATRPATPPSPPAELDNGKRKNLMAFNANSVRPLGFIASTAPEAGPPIRSVPVQVKVTNPKLKSAQSFVNKPTIPEGLKPQSGTVAANASDGTTGVRKQFNLEQKRADLSSHKDDLVELERAVWNDF